MKAFAIFVALLCAGACASAAPLAPDSIGNKVYRYFLADTANRSSSQKTIVFRADGRFIYLNNSSASFLDTLSKGRLPVLTSPDGAYTYQKTSDATGTIALHRDDQVTETIPLTFTRAEGGDQEHSAFVLSDLAAGQAVPAANISVRRHADSTHPLILGFVIPGESPNRDLSVVRPLPGYNQPEVLIRVVGPSLTSFGVTGVWADPDFTLYRGSTPLDPLDIHYSDWSVYPYVTTPNPTLNAAAQAAFRKIFTYAGAFPLLPDSKDAATLVRLDPGQYTIVCNVPAGDAGGEALVEVYFLP